MVDGKANYSVSNYRQHALHKDFPGLHSKDSIHGKRTVPCDRFINNLNLPQYQETFDKNLGLANNFLDRDNLEKITMRKLPTMNVQNFSHMKHIMKQIKYLRKRTKEDKRLGVDREVDYTGLELDSSVGNEFGLPSAVLPPQPVNLKVLPETSASKLHVPQEPIGGKNAERKNSFFAPNQALHRRHSKAIQSLAEIGSTGGSGFVRETGLTANLRRPSYAQNNSGSNVQVDDLSLGGGSRRLSSFGIDSEQKPGWKSGAGMDPEKRQKHLESRRKSLGYGNQALRTSVIEQGLKQLTKAVIEKFRDVIGCERASILYNDSSSEELVFFIENVCYRFPNVSGIAGFCLQTGESLNIEDAYKDKRFNKEIDKKSGYVTKSILARPIFSRFGGKIIAVVEMINKIGGPFTTQDEEVLEACCSGVSDALESKFSDLLTAVTALDETRKGPTTTAGDIDREMKELNALHESFMARVSGKIESEKEDRRYMNINDMDPNERSMEANKRRRRSEYAEGLRQEQTGL